MLTDLLSLGYQQSTCDSFRQPNSSFGANKHFKTTNWINSKTMYMVKTCRISRDDTHRYHLNYDNISYIDGLVQERRNSSAKTLGLRLSCTNPFIWSRNINREKIMNHRRSQNNHTWKYVVTDKSTAVHICPGKEEHVRRCARVAGLSQHTPVIQNSIWDVFGCLGIPIMPKLHNVL